MSTGRRRPEAQLTSSAPSLRAVIDQATGVLILLYRVNAEQAFWMLHTWARETDSTVLTVARTLVHAICLEDNTRSWDEDVRDHVEAALAEVRPITLPGARRARRGPGLRTVR